MTIREESVLEKLQRLEEEASHNNFAAHESSEQRSHELKLKGIEKDIEKLKTKRIIKEASVKYRWVTISDTLSDIIYFPIKMFVTVLIFILTCFKRNTPNWLKEIIRW